MPGEPGAASLSPDANKLEPEMNAITDKFGRSWQLFKNSVAVIRSHPKLLIFPIVTGFLTLAIALFFLAPVVLLVTAPHWIAGSGLQTIADRIGFLHFGHGKSHIQIQPIGALLLAGVYLLNMFLATMSSVAFNSEILEALSGRTVSIRHGIEVACQRWKAVLLWSLLAGSIGLILRSLEQRFSLLGRLVAGLIGLAWSVASIFAVPILVRETSLANPFEVISKSARVIKTTWGEMLTGYLGMQGTNLFVLWGSILFWMGCGAMARGRSALAVIAGCIRVSLEHRQPRLSLRALFIRHRGGCPGTLRRFDDEPGLENQKELIA
jgi:hypothetical protein